MLEIREAGTQHIDTIRELAFAIWPDAYASILSPAQLSYMLELIYSKEALAKQIDAGHQFILVYDNNTAVGFASYSAKNTTNPTIYRLQKLYVRTDQQGKGTGKFLLEHVIEQTKKAGASILELNVNRHNKAFHFYSKMGFVVSKEEDVDIGQGYFMNDYVMELKL